MFMVNSFVILLYVTVMINFLQEMTKTLSEKMLIDFYWFHNNIMKKYQKISIWFCGPKIHQRYE